MELEQWIKACFVVDIILGLSRIENLGSISDYYKSRLLEAIERWAEKVEKAA